MRSFAISKTLLSIAFFAMASIAMADETFDAAWSALPSEYSFGEPDPYFASALGMRYTASTRKYRFADLETYPDHAEPYKVTCLVQPQRADLVVVVPGLGSSQSGGASHAIGEHLFDNGYSVCLLSNSFAPEIYWHQTFMPGDLPAEEKFFWQVTRSIMIQMYDRINKIHLISASYGTEIARGIIDHFQREIDFLNRQYWRRRPLELASAVFLSPPRNLMKSMKILDSEWAKYKPALKNVGTLPLIQLSVDMLAYLSDGTLNKNIPNEEYRAFILKMGFYEGMQDMGNKLSEVHKLNWQSHPISFSDYYKELLIPVAGVPKYIPDFSEGWDQVKVPSLVLFADNDFILDQDDMQALLTINNPQEQHYSMMLKGGGHMGYLPRPDITQVVDLFMAEHRKLPD